MRPNECTTQVSVFKALYGDLRSPMHRLYRLQSMLKALHLALECEGATTSKNLPHLNAVAEYAFEESESIAGDLEEYLDEVPYVSPAKTS